jgi:mono/diheme cytochrome c family protein
MWSTKNKILLFATGVLLATGALLTQPRLSAQQHGYTPAEIDEGHKLYDANCGRCHNDTGDGVTGVELFKQIRRGSSDEDIVKIIRAGIPGTSMPPHNFSEMQAQNVVAYLRSMVGVTPASALAANGPGRGASAAQGGDPARGKALFEGKGGCLTCHRVNGVGAQTGPDLGRPVPQAGGPGGPGGGGRGGGFGGPAAINVAQLERSILDPNAEIAPAYRVYQVTPKSGAAVRGKLLNQDTFSVQLLDTGNQLRSFLKSDLKDYAFLSSPMPSYRGKFTQQEMADVLSYLVSAKGQPQ